MRELLCNQMTIVQGITTGFLSGPYDVSVKLNDEISVSISQCGKRTIVVSSEKKIECDKLFAGFQAVEKLLMLMDGRFYPIESLEYGSSDNDELDRYSDYEKEVLDKRLGYFNSRDFCQYSFLRLLQFSAVLNDELLSNWQCLLNEMDIAYQVFLYTLSDNHNPVDMNFAFLVEMAEPFVELIKSRKSFCKMLSLGDKKTELKMCLKELIKIFGKDIFAHESESEEDYYVFLQKAVGSRVRIMHIKRKQKNFFDEKECVVYSLKFSLLYRRILFELLNIPYCLYEASLREAVEKIDAYMQNGIENA